MINANKNVCSFLRQTIYEKLLQITKAKTGIDGWWAQYFKMLPKANLKVWIFHKSVGISNQFSNIDFVENTLNNYFNSSTISLEN